MSRPAQAELHDITIAEDVVPRHRLPLTNSQNISFSCPLNSDSKSGRDLYIELYGAPASIASRTILTSLSHLIIWFQLATVWVAIIKRALMWALFILALTNEAGG
jgi:hypothetical protein